MIEIRVQSEVEAVLNKFQGVLRSELSKATARSINRVVSMARTSAIREIRRTYNIKPKYFRERIGDKENRYNALKAWKASPNNLTATLKAYGKPIPLVAFPIKEDKTGISVSVFKGKSVHLKGAFMATMKSGHTSVFGRGKYNKGVFDYRNKRLRPYPVPDLPITQYLSTSLRAAVVQPSVLDAMKVRVEKELPKRLEHEVAYLLSKRR